MKNRILVEMSQAKDLPTKFWVEAIYYSNYLLNIILIITVCSSTLVEKWCGNNPSTSHLKMFKHIAWEHIFND